MNQSREPVGPDDVDRGGSDPSGEKSPSLSALAIGRIVGWLAFLLCAPFGWFFVPASEPMQEKLFGAALAGGIGGAVIGLVAAAVVLVVRRAD